MTNNESSLLLVTHVAVRQGPRGTQIDDQTAAGLSQWCQHFDRVTYYGIVADSNTVTSTVWVDVADIPFADRCEVRSLPHAYRVGRMARRLLPTYRLLRREVARHSHLCFTVGGLIGDWPALAAVEAFRQHRRYAAWIDRVEPLIIRNRLIGAPMRRRWAAALALPLMELYTRFILKRSAVALLQGLDTYNHYARWSSNPHCTYDTHTTMRDEISDDEIAGKQNRILAGLPLRIVYVGRAAEMKGPFDWLETLDTLWRDGIPFRATWIGDGPELEAMKSRVQKSSLAQVVELTGFESDRGVILRRMRESDLLLYCHKTAESPRTLIESLVSGCALVGYGTAYPRGLVEVAGGGAFASPGDVNALAALVADLDRDRDRLARLVADAAASGRTYNEDAVYGHRAHLMRSA